MLNRSREPECSKGRKRWLQRQLIVFEGIEGRPAHMQGWRQQPKKLYFHHYLANDFYDYQQRT
jgi:hypothetical protein